MKEQFIKFIQEKSPGAQPLLIVVRGSQAYGTNLPTSDTDYAGVYIQSIEDIFGTKYKEQINDDTNDTVFYEIKRFIELLASNNPTILELMNTPEDCIIYKHELYNLIIEQKDKFITKVCAKSFGGYAIQQIKKAKGQNKKTNWEKAKVTRKTPLDFCYIHLNEYSVELDKYLNDNNLQQQYCGLSKSPHGRDVYSLFYDESSHIEKLERSNIFKGIAFEGSNDIRLSSIPSGSDFIGHISYNKDGYMQHCNDYNSYQTWLRERNEQRWVDVESHGQKIDGKNMMHCRRLLEMAREIGEGKGIIVKRPNCDELISIRKGEIDLQSLIDRAEKDIMEIDEIFKNSNLPESIDNKIINDLLVKIRTKFYKVDN
jgi:hypothetical protein